MCISLIIKKEYTKANIYVKCILYINLLKEVKKWNYMREENILEMYKKHIDINSISENMGNMKMEENRNL